MSQSWVTFPVEVSYEVFTARVFGVRGGVGVRASGRNARAVVGDGGKRRRDARAICGAARRVDRGGGRGSGDGRDELSAAVVCRLGGRGQSRPSLPDWS